MNLKQKRIDAKMTQTQVSQVLGLSTGAYGHYETGRRSPKPDALKKIAEAFGCTVDELLEDPKDGENEQPNEDRGSDLVPQVYADADQRAA